MKNLTIALATTARLAFAGTASAHCGQCEGDHAGHDHAKAEAAAPAECDGCKGGEACDKTKCEKCDSGECADCAGAGCEKCAKAE